jgi:hypothetical protein
LKGLRNSRRLFLAALPAVRLDLHLAEHRPPDGVASLGGGQVKIGIELEQLLELAAARQFLARNTVNERQIFVRGELIAARRKPAIQGLLALSGGILVIAFLLSMEAQVQVLFGFPRER